MSVKNKNTEEKWLLPFCIIEDATTGNVMAINTVMKHYEGYIAKLATRKMYDEYGNVHYCVDKTLRDRLEAKLLKTILEFKIVSSGKAILDVGSTPCDKDFMTVCNIIIFSTFNFINQYSHEILSKRRNNSCPKEGSTMFIKYACPYICSL